MRLVCANRDNGSEGLKLKYRSTIDFCSNHQLSRAFQLLAAELGKGELACLPDANWDCQMNKCMCGVLDSFLIFSEY